LLTLTDTEPDAPSTAPKTLATAPSPKLVSRVGARFPGTLVEQGLETLFSPKRYWSLARLGTGTMVTMSKLIRRSPDPRTPFQGKLGVAKRVAWSRPVALAQVKGIGSAVGGTVNDVMLAAVTGALRRYLEHHGDVVKGLTIRAGLSVNLRTGANEPVLGNRAGAVLVDLPVGLESAQERLLQVKRRMDEIKESPEAGLVWGLMNALGKAPAEVQDSLVETYVARDTAVLANVRGPGETVYLAGAPLSVFMFWVPALGGAGLCLSIVSYAGQVRFGASTDRGLVPDPEEIIAGFHAEFEHLCLLLAERTSKQARSVTGGSSVTAMSAKLDEAIATLDALLQDS
jgi:WS/DGAT/MGAT family acyltransferase